MVSFLRLQCVPNSCISSPMILAPRFDQWCSCSWIMLTALVGTCLCSQPHASTKHTQQSKDNICYSLRVWNFHQCHCEICVPDSGRRTQCGSGQWPSVPRYQPEDCKGKVDVWSVCLIKLYKLINRAYTIMEHSCVFSFISVLFTRKHVLVGVDV